MLEPRTGESPDLSSHEDQEIEDPQTDWDEKQRNSSCPRITILVSDEITDSRPAQIGDIPEGSVDRETPLDLLVGGGGEEEQGKR